MITKQQVLAAITSLPDERFNIENVLEEIILLEKVTEGLEAIQKGDIISQEDAEQQMEKW